MATSVALTVPGSANVFDWVRGAVPFWFCHLGSFTVFQTDPEPETSTGPLPGAAMFILLALQSLGEWRIKRKADGIRYFFRVAGISASYAAASAQWVALMVVQVTDMSTRHLLLGAVMIAIAFVIRRLSHQGIYPGVLSLVRALAYAWFSYMSSYKWSVNVMVSIWLLEHWPALMSGVSAWRRSECRKLCDHVLWFWEACGLQRASRIVAEPSSEDFFYPAEAEAHSALATAWVEKEEVRGMIVVIAVHSSCDGASRKVVFEPIGMGFAGNGVLVLPAHLLVGAGSIAELLGRDGYRVVFAKAGNRLTANLTGTWSLSPADEAGLKVGNLDIVRAKHYTAGVDHVTSKDVGFLRCKNAGALFGTVQRKSWDVSLNGINSRVCRYVRDDRTGEFVLKWACANIVKTTSLGMYTQSAGSVPGMSGALVVTSEGKVMGMNLGDTTPEGGKPTGTLVGSRQIGVVAGKCCVPLDSVFRWAEVRAAHSKGLDKLRRLFQRGNEGDRHSMSGREGANDQSYEDDWCAYDAEKEAKEADDDEDMEGERDDLLDGTAQNATHKYRCEAKKHKRALFDRDEHSGLDSSEKSELSLEIVALTQLVHAQGVMLADIRQGQVSLACQIKALRRDDDWAAAQTCAEPHTAVTQLVPPPSGLMDAVEKCETVLTLDWLKAVKAEPDQVLIDLDRQAHRSLFADEDSSQRSPESAPVASARPRRRRPAKAEPAGLGANKVAHVKHFRPDYEGMKVGDAIRAANAKEDRDTKAPVKAPKPAQPVRVAHTGVSFHGVHAATPSSPQGEMVGLCAVCLEPSAASSCFCSKHEIVHEALVATDMPSVGSEVQQQLATYISSKCNSITETLEMGGFTWEKHEGPPRFTHNNRPFLEVVGTTKFKSGKPQGKTEVDKAPQPKFVDVAVEAGFEQEEVADFTWPDQSHFGIFDSMAANLSKRIAHNEVLPGELTEFIHKTVVNPPLPVGPHLDADLARSIGEWTRAYIDLEELPACAGERSPEELFMHTFVPLVDQAISACNPDKSAGWTGSIMGKPLKGAIMSDPASLKLVKRTALERLWLYCTVRDVAFCSAEQMVLLGLRDPVVPAVKGEMHPGRKVYKRDSSKAYVLEGGKRVKLENPRWRTIYSQSMVDEVVGRVLEKPHNARQQALYAAGAGVWTGIGTGSDDANVRLTKARVTAALFASPDGCVVSDDVSGMDWCGSGWSAAVDIAARLATAHSCVPDQPNADEALLHLMIFRGLVAYGCSLARSTYLVGDVLVSQAVQGINDSGVLSTGFKNSTPRAFLAWLTGALGATACGDDCVAVYSKLVESGALTAVARRYGFEIRDQLLRRYGEGGGFECCSKLYSWDADAVYSFLNLPKAVAKVCSNGVLSDDTYAGLLFETRHDPVNRCKWIKFRELLATVGLCGDGDVAARPCPDEDPLDANF